MRNGSLSPGRLFKRARRGLCFLQGTRRTASQVRVLMSCGSTRVVEGEEITCYKHSNHFPAPHHGILDDLSTIEWEDFSGAEILRHRPSFALPE